MEYLKMIISSNVNMREVFNTIMDKDRQIWRKFHGADELLKWLHNFHGEDEIYLALLLANKVLYYSQDQIKYLWNYILTNQIKLYLLDVFYKGRLPSNIDKWFEGYLQNKCIFVGYGNAGKSGQSMVYTFEKSHNIEGLKYMEKFEFLNGSNDLSSVKVIFLLDDFVGSGHQARTEWFNDTKGKSFNDIHTKNPDILFVYLALVGYVDGIKYIADNTPMKVIIGEELDEKFKCFSDVSIIYENSSERRRAKELMEEKGRILYEYPLGYNNLELAIAFYHNTPNNSLPVIWKRTRDESWQPLFERFD